MILVNSKTGEVEVCKIFKFMSSICGAAFIFIAFAAVNMLVMTNG